MTSKDAVVPVDDVVDGEVCMQVLSLGAGVQSTALALMACDGTLPGLDAAIFADTGWEPAAVYRQVDLIEAELAKIGVPLYRVSQGNLRQDVLNPEKRFASPPWYTLAPEGMTKPAQVPCPDCVGGVNPFCKTCDGVTGTIDDPSGRRVPLKYDERLGIGRRQCTYQYKLRPIMQKIRELLGAKPPDFRSVPRGRVAEQWIGFSTDEITRANDRRENLYTVRRFPLLDMGMSRTDCERYLARVGWGHTAKSACIGCPYHGNAHWRDMRKNHPEDWADAVDFDQQIRKGGARAVSVGEALRGEAFLHSSRLPLSIAPIDKVSRKEYGEMQGDLFDPVEDGDYDGCSPFSCRSGEPVVEVDLDT
jgi:hypothetical protein